MFSLNYHLVVFLLVIIVDRSSCACRQSYITICDSLEDLQNATDRDTWIELLVGSEKSTPSLSKNLLEIRFNLFNRLTSMTIFRQLKEITTQYGLRCVYATSRLKVLNFYGNDLQTLKSYSFPRITLRRLGLINNNIEFIEKFTFSGLSIDEMDLSDNHLEVIESYTFESMKNLKSLTINNNKLSHIETDSFPPMLEILILESNNLRHLQSELLSNLTKLTDISLKNNKFTVLPEGVKLLTQLLSLDFSYNRIAQIHDDIFGHLPQLLLVDLSNNQIGGATFLGSLLTPEKGKVEISLAFNRMEAIAFHNMTMGTHVLYFFGNPWDCKGWEEVVPVVRENQDQCDKLFFNSGKTPYCLSYMSVFDYSKQTELDVERFLQVIKNNEKLIPCRLSPDKSEILYQIQWHCVA